MFYIILDKDTWCTYWNTISSRPCHIPIAQSVGTINVGNKINKWTCLRSRWANTYNKLIKSLVRIKEVNIIWTVSMASLLTIAAWLHFTVEWSNQWINLIVDVLNYMYNSDEHRRSTLLATSNSSSRRHTHRHKLTELFYAVTPEYRVVCCE